MKSVIPMDIVTLGDDSSYHLFVRGEIDGKPCDLLIDTGASQTVFDKASVHTVKLKGKKPEIQSSGIHAGELNTDIGKVKKFKLGELKCKNWQVVTIDLSHVNELYQKFSDKKVSGLLGSDFLLQYKALIDYKRKELVLRGIKK